MKPTERALSRSSELSSLLVCPVHGALLRWHGTDRKEVEPWPDGQLICPTGCSFQVADGIPRFVEAGHYAAAFALQWARYQKTQLDSYSGMPLSRKRLEFALGTSLAALRGKSVLECGAGAGRFTELMLDHADTLVSLDLSEAVEANLKNCGGRTPYLLVQADIEAMPLPRKAFDVVICLGVLQHTPSPEVSIRHLAERVKPGGTLIIDHYAKRPLIGSIGQYLTLGFPLRAILKRLGPQAGLRATDAISALCDPIRKRTCR